MSGPTRQRYAMATGSMPEAPKSGKTGYAKGGKARKAMNQMSKPTSGQKGGMRGKTRC